MCPKKCHLSWMDDKNSEKSCKYFFRHQLKKIRAKVGVNLGWDGIGSCWRGWAEGKKKMSKKKSFLFDNRKLGIALVLFWSRRMSSSIVHSGLKYRKIFNPLWAIDDNICQYQKSTKAIPNFLLSKRQIFLFYILFSHFKPTVNCITQPEDVSAVVFQSKCRSNIIQLLLHMTDQSSKIGVQCYCYHFIWDKCFCKYILSWLIRKFWSCNWDYTFEKISLKCGWVFDPKNV